MLHTFRKGAHSFPAKILLGFLILTFAVWGVGDMLLSSSPNAVATVGGEAITAQDLEQAIRQLQAEIPQLTADVASSLPVQLQVLQRLINTRLLQREANELGIHFSQEALSERIANDPMFHDKNGQFSRDRFLGLLQQSNQSQGMFMQRFAADMQIGLLHSVLVKSISVQPELAKLYFKIQRESREASIVVVESNAEATKTIEPPSEEELRTLYGNSAEQFSEPEYRSYRYASFGADDIKSDAPSEAQMQTYYDEHQDLYRDAQGAVQPFESVKQSIETLLREQAAADQLAKVTVQLDDAVAGGSSLEEALAGAGLSHLKIDTIGAISAGGALKNGQLLEMSPAEENALQTAFELNADEISPLTSIESRYYLVHTLEVTPSSVPAFEAVKEQLTAILMDERARDALRDKANALATELQQAENPLAAAKERGLEPLDAGVITRQSTFINRRNAPKLPINTAFMSALYELRLNEVSSAVALDNGQSAIIMLRAIHDAPEPDAAALAAMREQLNVQFGEQAIGAYLGALREKYGVELFMDKLATQQPADGA